MRSFSLLLFVLLAGCGSSSTPLDGGSSDGGDAGSVPVTDGGAIGAACSTYLQCAGNPICSETLACPSAVICANLACASAGGPALVEQAAVGFAPTATRLPTYVQVFLLSADLVKGGTLDCPTALTQLDAGTLSPGDITQVNPLCGSYQQSVHPMAVTDVVMVPLGEAASGPERVLLMQGYLSSAQSDAGDDLVAVGCATFDDSADAGTVSITLQP